MTSQAHPPATADVRAEDRRLDVLEVLFAASACLAPLNLKVFRALTVYDLSIAVLAVLVLTGPRPMVWIPPSLRIAGLLLVLAGLASAFRSTYPMEAVFQVGQYAFVFFVQLPVILTLARTRRVIHATIGMLILGYLVVVVLAVVLERVQLAGRVVPFFNDSPNALATPTVFLAPFAAYFAIVQWRRGRWLLSLIAGGTVLYLFIWALTASASRGATGATIVALALFGAMGYDSRIDLRAIARVVLVAAAIVGLAVLVYRTSVFPDTLRDRVERTLDPQGEPGIAEGRVALNRAGMQAFLDSPLIGTGLNNFRYVAQFYDDDASFHEPHNLWIQFLAQTGLVGTGAFLFIVVRWFVLLFRTRSLTVDRIDRLLLAAFIAAFAGVLAQSMVAPLVLHRHYWLLYGLGMAAAVVVAQRTEPERD